MSHHNRAKKILLSPLAIALGLVGATPAVNAVTLNERCVVNILNRTVQVRPDGGWALPNIPSNMGQIRARATCTLEDGRTVSGQSDYFNIQRDGITRAGDIKFENLDPIPQNLNFSSQDTLELNELSQTAQLKLTAYYADGAIKDVSAAATGVNYSSTNALVAEVSADGLVTPKSNGVVLINARKDGVLASRRVAVVLGGDLDNDGLPDEWERANGLNPNDPVDALEDHDGDGLTAREEFALGTDIRNADTDGDGISDKEESEPGADGVVTSPLLEDTDGDGISDGLEIAGGSDPNDAQSGNLSDFLDHLQVTPPQLELTYNAIDGEASAQLNVTGYMIDGSTVDLTGQTTGTRYQTDNIEIANFGIADGQIFAGRNGTAKVTVSNNGKQYVVNVNVTEFEPVAQRALAIPGYANNVDIAGNYAYVAAGSAGLQVVDYSVKTNPQIVGSVALAGTAIDVKVAGDYAYLAGGKAGLHIVDISNPASPQWIATADTAGIAQDVVLQDQFAYVADGAAGIEVFNIVNANKPFSVGSTDVLVDVKGLAVENNRMVAVGGNALALFDIATPATPLRLTSVNIGPVKDVVLDNGYAYVAAYSSGYRVYKITEANGLELKGGDRTFVPRDVAVTNGFAFFAEQLFPNVVAYLNIKAPENPFFQDTIDLSPLGDYAGTGLALNATHAFVTEESFVVGKDYGVSGTTKLFSAQYRQLNDQNGVPPQIVLTEPRSNTVTVEGARIILKSDATDDIAIQHVEFYVNNARIGTDYTFPYQMPYEVPFGVNALAIRAEAIDLGGNTNETGITTLEVQKDGDRDGLGNQQETEVYLTNPDKPDTDEDGVSDGEEVARGIDPNKQDSDGDGLLDGAEIANGTDPSNPDVTAPTVVSNEPADAATEIAENAAIIVTFSEALGKKSITADSLVVLEQGTVPVAGNVRLIGDDTQLLFNGTELFKDYTPYTVQVSGVKDTAGNPLAETFSFSFETGNTVDTVRPTVERTIPSSNASEIPVNVGVSLTMSERIDQQTVTAETFYITDTTTNERIDGVVEVKEDSQTLTFTPNAAFLVGRRHAITLKRDVKDLFGNTMGWDRTYYFTTSFEADGTAPVVTATSFNDGRTDIPLNGRLRVKMSESINPYSIKHVKLLKDGAEVLSEITLSGDARLITIKPRLNLEASSAYSLFVDQLEDLSGNIQAQPHIVNFTTGTETDTTSGRLSSYSPLSNTDVPANVILTATYDGPIDATSIDSTTIRIYNESQGRYVSGDFQLSADARQVHFSSDEYVHGQRYRIYYSGLSDYAGYNYYSAGWFYYNVVSDNDNQAPQVQASNIVDGLTNVAVNTPIRLNFDEALGFECVNPGTIQLLVNGVAVEATVTLSSDRRQVTVRAAEDLAAGTTYQVVANGLCDVAGNQLNNYSLSFTTNAEGSRDTTRPDLVEITPASGSEDVDVGTAIVMTFSETMDPTNGYDQFRITTSGANGVSGTIGGDFTFNDNVVTFKPYNPLPGNTTIQIYMYYVRDVAGNTRCCYSYTFKTQSLFDTEAPQIVAISPADGAMDVGINVPVVIRFNESLNAATVDSNNFKLYSDGTLYTPSVYRSQDGRTVTLRGTWPAGQNMSVIVTDDVTDLSNNSLGDYASVFATAKVNTDTSRPSVQRQYPLNGANNISPDTKITLYTSEPMDPATLADGLNIAQNGIILRGDIQLASSGQSITFIPDSPLEQNALIQVYLDSNAKDASGNALSNYQGQFQVASTATAGVRPDPSVYIPSNGDTNIVVNPTLQVAYTQALNEAFINDTYIVLRGDNTIIPATLSLSEDKRIVTIKPDNNLAADTYHYVSLDYRIEDTDGEQQRYSRSYGFTTGSETAPDNQQPMITALSPAEGAQNVPLNPRFTVRFDEPVNSLTAQQDINSTVWLNNNNTQLLYYYHQPLAANLEHVETVQGMSDLAGNTVVPRSTTFKTADSVDVVRPNYESYHPQSNQAIGTNGTVVWRMDEVIDPLTVTEGTVYVQDTEETSWPRVPGKANWSADGRTITWVPDNVLPVGRRFYAVLGSVADLTGSTNSTDTFYFETLVTQDQQAPVKVSSSVQEGLQNVATNARLRVRFDEPVHQQHLDGVTLQHNGQDLPVSISLADSRREVVVIPRTLMPGQSDLTLTLAGIRDASNNVTATFAISFTTETGVNTTGGYIVSYSPKGGTDVAANAKLTATYADRIDPTSVTTDNFRLYNQTQGRYITGTYSFSEDGKTVTMTPSQLVVGEYYRVYLSNLRDVAGNSFSASGWHYFTVTSEADNTAPVIGSSNILEGQTEIAVNAVIRLNFAEQLTRPVCQQQHRTIDGQRSGGRSDHQPEQ